MREKKRAGHVWRVNSLHERLGRLADARGATRPAGPREPAARARPRAPHLELPGAGLVPARTVPAAAAARVSPMAHVRGLRRRRRGAAARGRGPLREVASRNNARMKRAVEQTVAVKRRALEIGFDAVGVASLERNAHADELDRWLNAGYAGTMTYLHRQAEKRKDPARIMPGAKVAVVTLTNYFHGSAHPGLAPGVSPALGKVAQYAWSTDYHGVLGRRLERLATAVREIVPGAKARCYVDAGPLRERY